MPIEGLDAERCRARRRLAARRDGVETAPLRFLPTEELSAKGQRGTLPQAPDAVMSAINALLPEGVKPLTPDDVFVHFAEAANTNFIPDRYAFMDRSTLRNIAAGAARGVAFMNSHRTGGMSTDTELPFGKTFAGRYDENEEGARTTIGVYMLRANSDGEPLRPTGANGPSTADLHAMIEGGVIADTSVGLFPGGDGEYLCDVCGEDLREADDKGGYLCPHCPGTTHGMDEKQQKAQRSRGVPKGRASYSMVNFGFSEQSAVYDGAVPGAGIRRVMSFSRQGVFGPEALAEIREAYGDLLRHGFSPRDLKPISDARIDAIFPPDEGDPPTGLAFVDHSQSVLTAVGNYLARVRSYAALRESQGRPLSPERRADFTRLRDDLTRLLEATLPKADEAAVIALRARILRRQASRREAVRE